MERIKKTTLAFLSDLKVHNEKEWFNDNRKRYDDARSNFTSFIENLINEISTFDPILKGLEAKSCMYRINRDIRFSNDKTIYKTHLGAYILRGGKNNADHLAGYYIHVEPGGNSMIAGGAYLPPMPWLSEIRENISEQGDKLVKIISDKEFIRCYGELDGERLKTAPKGYPKDHKYIELLKLKSFLGAKTFKDEEVTKDSWYNDIIAYSRAIKPLIDFLNDY